MGNTTKTFDIAALKAKMAANKPMTQDEMKALLDAMKAENEALRAKKAASPISIKASEKGAVSVYGLGRFPVTLYKEQWERLLKHADAITQFIAENEASLSVKGEKEPAKAA